LALYHEPRQEASLFERTEGRVDLAPG
jgi:hypothetical protein